MTSSTHKRSLWRVHNLTWKSLALFRALCYCELYTYSCTYCWLKFILTFLSILSPKLLVIWIIVLFCGSGLSFCEFVSLYYWVNVWLEATRPGFCLKEHRWPINCALVQPADDHIRAMFLSRNRVVEGHSGPGQSVNINSSCAAAAGWLLDPTPRCFLTATVWKLKGLRCSLALPYTPSPPGSRGPDSRCRNFSTSRHIYYSTLVLGLRSAPAFYLPTLYVDNWVLISLLFFHLYLRSFTVGKQCWTCHIIPNE